MSEQRFDIVVQDKVARTIRAELAGIGTGARGAYDQLKLLNSELSRNTATAAGQAQAATTRAAAATASLNAQQAKAAVQAARLDDAQLKAAVSAERLAQAQAKTALAQQKVATEAARTAEAQSKANIAYVREEEALNRAVAAEQRAIESKDKLAAATQRAATAAAKPVAAPVNLFSAYDAQQAAKAAGGSRAVSAGADVAAVGALGAAASGTKAASAEVVKDVEQMATKTAPLFSRFKTGATSAFDVVRDFASGNGSRFRSEAVALAAGAETAASRIGHLGEKAVLSSTAVRELLVIAREGGRGDFTRMAGSVSILASATGVLGTVLPIAAVAFGGLYTAHKAFNDDLAKSQLKEYANSLGLTTKEMRKLSDTHLDAKGHLEELNLIQITYMDTLKGFWATLTQNQEANSFWDTFKQRALDNLTAIEQKLKDFAATAYAVLEGTRRAMNDVQSHYNLPSILHDVMTGQDHTKGVDIGKDYNGAFADAQKGMTGFYKSWQDNSMKAAKQRLKDEAGAIIGNRNTPKGPKPWDRAQNLQNDNAALDAQTKNLTLYGSALERANQLEEISKKYRDHNVPLTQAETAALSAKILALQEGRRVQEAMTAAEEAANGPIRKYEDAVTALNNLLEQGAISHDQFTAQMNLATRAYEDATNPLAKFNRELEKSGMLAGKFGKDKDVQQYIQQLQNAAEAQGKSIYQPGKGAANDNGITVTGRSNRLTGEAQSAVDEYQRQQKQGDYTQVFSAISSKDKKNDPNNTSAFILDNYKKLYQNIDDLRQKDVISEQDATERKRDLDKALGDARLQSASTVLGNLASLQSSHNRTVAAMGKAAAVAQATIDGYRAVQAALAGPPGPPWSFAIAASVGVMTAANVAKIAGVGFESGGYTGNGGTKEVAGAVHGQEYVMDAASTRRIGVPALDAMRAGGTLGQPANNNGGGGPKVSVYPQAGVVMHDVSTSDDHIEMIAERVARKVAPHAVKDDINRGANSPVSKAMQTQYNVRRNR